MNIKQHIKTVQTFRYILMELYRLRMLDKRCMGICVLIHRFYAREDKLSVAQLNDVVRWFESKKPSTSQYQDTFWIHSSFTEDDCSGYWWPIREFEERIRFVEVLLGELESKTYIRVLVFFANIYRSIKSKVTR